ncbi:nitroreductase family protein [Acinetobacter nosocomialis]|uniref:nitroreductase family protein n=1 Tax=Acinetobacter calcoaceticus/baumannii complex TaxID=909768 RepID=UPI00044E2707|nr:MULTISPECIES: nitroreductase family protein [Acinetobacter calcoaceticus/baumannii complex]EKU6036855.1 nitroreductase family protein [Acinetobacter nosocomialis]EXE70205.1 nitroreductase family protein [Acinetobacter sp. 1566109]EXE73767.1 nitroreductase family protein [Acinetobacter sp. 1566109]EXE77030.1 nitroreductase family protein [Acinetobacter sp. 1566109]EXR18435.1 nitroreductase family protein [Acinetobacter sp. 1130196]
MSFFAKLFGLNQKTTAQEDVALKAAQELESSNETSFIELIKNRRSIYAIGNNLNQSNDEIEKLIQEAIRHSPSAFNSQSSRAVILFGQSHHKFWNTVLEVLKSIVPAEAVSGTEQKIQSFAAGAGTVLFYEDQNVVKGLQEQFAAYADNFPIWSEHSTAIAQFAVWNILTEQGIGASLQHYNPIIDEKINVLFNIPSEWKLRAQLVFGSIEAKAGEKTFIDDESRFKTFG